MTALLGGALAVPAPALAAPKCGPAGGPAPTEVPWALSRSTRPPPGGSAGRRDHRRGDRLRGLADPSPLRGRVLPGEDFNQLVRLKGQCDLVGHGTMVAGIIAGREGTGTPYTGIAPEARSCRCGCWPRTRRTSTRTCRPRSARRSVGPSTTTPT
ncbi:hypothetical protein V2I01_17235 [Micromonospora sp. BRA006-A]|nr:hypothetical protein [Micromonospora sp. BRA006-A]